MKYVPDLLAKSARLNPDKRAMLNLPDGRELTYGELDQRASRCAHALASQGVERGDRVSILCRNRPEFFECLFACARVGAILVPLNWRMPAEEIMPVLALSQPKVLIAGEEDRDTGMQLAAECDTALIDLDDPGKEGYEALLAGAADDLPLPDWPLEECWYLLFTSGTTGTPKAVMQTYAMALVNYMNLTRPIGLTGQDRTVNFLPLFHTAGINLHTLPALFEGAEVLIMPGFDADTIMGLIAQARIDCFFGVPAVYQELALHRDFSATDFSTVRSWGCGGAPLPDHLLDLYLSRGIHVCNGMGMTETGPTLFLMAPGDVDAKRGSVGRPQLLTEVRIADENDQPLPAEEEGELQMRGPGITPGYWQNEAATKAAFSVDGWLKSGDIARCDADGFFYIVGRSKDMYISGGENVYPAEVENILAGHPDIVDAAVTGVADDKWGEVGCAFTQITEGRALSVDEIRSYARGKLAAYKVPKHVVFVKDFPRTAAGKIQKHLLKRGEDDA